jgi:hypothetical protein
LKPKERAPFQIHFDRLPRRFLLLLLAALEPSDPVRHKVGYGKSFGFGSVRFRVTRVIRRQVGGAESGFSLQQTDEDVEALWRAVAAEKWSWACDPVALEDSDRWLRYILTYPSERLLQSQLFLYPALKKFWTPNPPGIIGLTNPGDKKAAAVADAKRYWNEYEKTRQAPQPYGKQALDLGLYQRKSPDFVDVCARATLKGEKRLDEMIHKEAI